MSKPIIFALVVSNIVIFFISNRSKHCYPLFVSLAERNNFDTIPNTRQTAGSTSTRYFDGYPGTRVPDPQNGNTHEAGRVRAPEICGYPSVAGTRRGTNFTHIPITMWVKRSPQIDRGGGGGSGGDMLTITRDIVIDH